MRSAPNDRASGTRDANSKRGAAMGVGRSGAGVTVAAIGEAAAIEHEPSGSAGQRGSSPPQHVPSASQQVDAAHVVAGLAKSRTRMQNVRISMEQS